MYKNVWCIKNEILLINLFCKNMSDKYLGSRKIAYEDQPVKYGKYLVLITGIIIWYYYG